MLLNNQRGPKVTYEVRYQGGRKTFDRLEGNDPDVFARAFAAQQRAKDKGWAEIARVSTEIIERKR
ncbi:hypothetical protein [Sphingomonas desiccabilis]|uniref:Uncharacterized protein n=1 Tax=Sphingomonas desiccabilis TaxID=429134 RepID=A0A4Q2IW49_9SPHN|nr:hypothetical protein [Sphingomonas desiccabilis]MBB3910130.1 hypothetical protein [Sphingomonas desiccabilis]RXZ34815.1 hypothetical protein EO081_03920 [Sphingomonas desiccabilis]